MKPKENVQIITIENAIEELKENLHDIKWNHGHSSALRNTLHYLEIQGIKGIRFIKKHNFYYEHY